MSPPIDAEMLAPAMAGATASPDLRVVVSTESFAEPQHSALLTSLLDGEGSPSFRAGVDFVALLTAVTLASSAPALTLKLLPLVPLVMVIFWFRGMYRRRISALLAREMISTASVLATCTIVVAIVNSYIAGNPLPEPLLLRAWILGVACVAGGRVGVVVIRQLARSFGSVGTPTLIVGTGKIGTQIAKRLVDRRGYGLRPLGFLDFSSGPHHAASASDACDLPLLGSPDDLEHVVRRTGAQHVVIAFARERDQDLVPFIRRCNRLGVDVSLVPRLFESVNHRLTRDSVGPLPLHVMAPTNPRSWEFACKHVMDRTLAAIALACLSPLLLLTALAVKLTSPGPALFRQRRIGRDGQCFEMLKFRSMLVADPSSWEGPTLGLAPGGIEGIDRRTSIGRWLRRTSIDELPQLWNVLRGQMSIVGPRPERPEYVERFRGEVERYDDRHRVKSGITGAAQVNGLRGQTGLTDRIEWDNYYIENWSLTLDLKILIHTVLAVLRPVE